MQKQFILEGLDCPNCAMKVERGVAKLSGVKEASVDFTHKKLFVDYEGDMSDRIKATIIALNQTFMLLKSKESLTMSTLINIISIPMRIATAMSMIAVL